LATAEAVDVFVRETQKEMNVDASLAFYLAETKRANEPEP
jgi:hypothetical protein